MTKIQELTVEPKKIYSRLFLVKGLPDRISASDHHLQIFDNYIENTMLRIRKARDPSTDERLRLMEKLEWMPSGSAAERNISQISLDQEEYFNLKQFEGREIRKNRYFYAENGADYDIDIYLGKLWGLNIATVRFEALEEASSFEVPEFCLLDVTTDPFFYGDRIVEKRFTDVQAHVQNRAQTTT